MTAQDCKNSNESGSTLLRLCANNGDEQNSFSRDSSPDHRLSNINTFPGNPNVIMPRAPQLSVSTSATAASSASATAGAQNGNSPGLCGPGNDGYTGAQMAGLGVGVGVPFALAFFVTLVLLAREKKRNKALMTGGAPGVYGPLKQQEGDVGQLYVQPSSQPHPGSAADGPSPRLPAQK